MFDEPVNGLDPEGIVWVRHLMKKLAGEGRTVLVSSHLMSEMALTADHLLVIGKGRLIASAATQDFIDQSSEQSVLVRSDDDEALARQVTELGASVERAMGGGFEVSGIPSDAVGKLALSGGIILSELTPRKASLGDC
jgi:ABC-2 type transport system ATP-binding protein